MHSYSTHLTWLAALAAMLAMACWFDLRQRRIPNSVVLLGTCLALALAWRADSVVSALLGATVGFALLLPFHWQRAMGSGDVKLLAATGAFVGFPAIASVALCTFLAGGILALAWMIRPRAARLIPALGHLQGADTRLPYALAISAGVILHSMLPWAAAPSTL